MPRLFEIALLIFCSSLLWPQTETAAVTFTIDFPTSQPEHYSIRVQSDSAAHYQSSGRLSADSDGTDSFDSSFSVTRETGQKILDIAAKADYFRKDVDSHRKGMAFTGKKTLCFE